LRECDFGTTKGIRFYDKRVYQAFGLLPVHVQDCRPMKGTVKEKPFSPRGKGHFDDAWQAISIVRHPADFEPSPRLQWRTSRHELRRQRRGF
jgi:hypothetical protein